MKTKTIPIENKAQIRPLSELKSFKWVKNSDVLTPRISKSGKESKIKTSPKIKSFLNNLCFGCINYR